MKLSGLFIALVAGYMLALHPVAAQEKLTNQNIIALSEAKVSSQIIAGKIKSSVNTFDLSTNAIIDMKARKGSDGIILEMMLAAGKLPEMTNGDVILLWNNKVSKGLILDKIKHSPRNYDTSTDGLIALKAAKIPDAIIKAMMNPPAEEKKDKDTTKPASTNKKLFDF